MRRIVLFAFTIGLTLLTLAAAAVVTAQDAANISVRANVQDGFIRLVFTGATLPAATIAEDGADGVRITFARAVNVSGLGSAVSGITPPTSVTASGPAVLQVKTGDLARHRTLALGNRLFVDLFTKAAPAGGSAQAPAQTQTQTQTPPTPAPIVTPPAVPVPQVSTETLAPPEAEAPPASASLVTEDAAGTQQTPAPATAPAAETPAAQAESAVAPVVSPATPAPVAAGQPDRPFSGSAVITIGSTQGVALAAFVRSGYLWIVLSQPQLSVAPQVSGPSAAALGPLDAVAIDGGSAYRVRLPEGAHVRPEGAGLVWRLHVEDKKPTLQSLPANRDYGNTAEGPMLRIPVANAISALRVTDPLIGDDLAVITVARADTRLINADRYVDFDLLPAIVGIVVRPKADGLRIAVQQSEVVVSRQGGLRLSVLGPNRTTRAAPARTAQPRADGTGTVDANAGPSVPPDTPSAIFAMREWAMGGPQQYLDMRRSIDARLAEAPQDRKLPEVLSGAKFMLAQGLPQEANGFLQMALGFMPSLRESGEFQAIHGAVMALMGDSAPALAAFSAPGLEKNDEVSLWRAYALAREGMQDGQMTEAHKAFTPQARKVLALYPERLRALMLPPLIEATLARGDVVDADALVESYDAATQATGDADRESAVAYFRGRIAQLRGDADGASEQYRAAAEGLHGPYPVRATLALVERGLSAKTIDRDEAVRKLERFRYGWRGDNLESQVLERLGLVYVTGGEQRRGLTILRDAASLTADTAVRDKMVAVMQKAFRELFSGRSKETMSPLEAAAVAAEFSELMPAGGEGEAITMAIADQMVGVDLLDRAAGMIEPMISRTAQAADALRYAQRAAAIRIINKQPDEALAVLDAVLKRPDLQGKPLSEADRKAFTLLRAKAKAERGRVDDALAELATLPEDAETLRLSADISWAAQRWPLAASAFGKLVATQDLSATKPVTRDQAQLVLNQALALNLAGNTEALDSMRVAYSDIMRRSELHQPFQLVTRSAQEATLADRETLLKLVSEVNMFKDVLDSYKIQPDQPVEPVAGQ